MSSNIQAKFAQKLADWKHISACACSLICEEENMGQCPTRRWFVKPKDVRDWFVTCESGNPSTNGRQLLYSLDPDLRRYRQSQFPNDSHLIDNGSGSCVLTLATLQTEGYGHLIHLFKDSGIIDKYLVNELRKSHTDLERAFDHHKVPDQDDIHTRFQERKWSFCPVELTFQMEGDFSDGNHILPFHLRKAINDKGGTASVFLVAIEKDLIEDERLREVLSRTEYRDKKLDRLCYETAVKTYREDNKDAYYFEREAFRAIGNDEDAPIIRYLGSFSHRSEGKSGKDSLDDEKESPTTSHNLLLEYGENDLDEFWADLENQPPVRTAEVIDFWTSLFRIAEAIMKLHRFHFNYYGEERTYAGCHADIKPENILIVQGQFKLADFGFARFVEHTGNGYELPRHKIEGGTETYGAPELQSAEKEVTQMIDTWSFGCVLSVAATWVVLGFQGIRAFQILRAQAAKSFPEDGHVWDSFHDGHDVLPEIKHWHNYLRDAIKPSDTATSRVLDLIETRMLKKDPNDRLRSPRLYEELKDLIRDARNAHDSLLRDGRLHLTDSCVKKALLGLERGTLTQDGTLQVPKTEPGPSKTSQMLEIPVFHPSNQKSRRLNKDSKLARNPLPRTPHRQAIIERELRMLSPHGHTLDNFGATEHMMTYGSPSETTGLSQQHTVEIPRSGSGSGTRHITGVPTPMWSKEAAGVVEPDQNLYLYEGRSLQGKQPQRTEQTPTKVAYEERKLVAPAVTLSGPETASNELNKVVSSNTRNSLLGPSRTSLEETTPCSTPKSRFDENVETLHGTPAEVSIPASIFDMGLDICSHRLNLEEKFRRKGMLENFKNFLGKEKPDPELEKWISGRNIVFVIDNSTSMLQYWPIITFVVVTLAKKIGPLDKDGIDVRFTIPEDCRHDRNRLKGSKGIEKLEKALRSAIPAKPINPNICDPTDMGKTLEQISQDFLKFRSHEAMTLIILTDGSWKGTETDNPEKVIGQKIAETHKVVKRRGKTDRYFSVQFIRFGTDKELKKRFKYLDDKLPKDKQISDVVDEVTWTSSVLKMLMGSFRPDVDRTSGGDDGDKKLEWLDSPAVRETAFRLFDEYNSNRNLSVPSPSFLGHSRKSTGSSVSTGYS